MAKGSLELSGTWNPRLNVDDLLEFLKRLDQHILDAFEVYKVHENLYLDHLHTIKVFHPNWFLRVSCIPQKITKKPTS